MSTFIALRVPAAVVVAGLAATLAWGTAPPASAAESGDADALQVTSVTQSDALTPTPEMIGEYDAGRYIVVLSDPPAVGAPGETEPHDSDAIDDVAADLAGQQDDVASSVGAEPIENLTVTTNGFVADLTAEQAARLALDSSVAQVVPDEIVPLAATSTDFIGLSGPGGVWERLGGAEALGDGVVVGVVDSGIAPENPSFAGEPLGSVPSDSEPYRAGDSIVYQKSDGGTFTGTCQTGEQFTADDCSTKIIGAQYFSVGFPDIGTPEQGEYRSPRDGSGHGSHVASTAAGNTGVDAEGESISGVTPGARIAMYKACWNGPVEWASFDDGCASSDLLSAIDAATRDQVDVINYSIGGGAAETTVSLIDQAFLAAASAGIFVSAAAGNAGPEESTLDNASPWITTVAASTIPPVPATVVLGDDQAFVGTSSTVSTPLTGPLALSADLAANGDTASATLCIADSLDPAKVAGKIVVCERGTNDRVAKSAAVKAAGGIGMILVNPTANSIDADAHTVPTVHLDADAYPALKAYAAAAGATATLEPGNDRDLPTVPTPQIAGFSSRGPVLADGSDILKPDVAAPGVGILAAFANAEDADPEFAFLSGTSMASPHVAGLGAMYLSQHPSASPSEIKSALMTTAKDTLTASGTPETDPFAQGAGQVQPASFLEPGLAYLSDTDDWLDYAAAFGVVKDRDPVDPSDLNLASIAIGALPGKQTVTRTVTAMGPGSYTADVSGLEGFDVQVEPAALSFTKAGEEGTFTVTFSRTTAPTEEFATGFLTWTNGGDGADVRSPIAVSPQKFDAPAFVAGSGATGGVDVGTVFGVPASYDVTTQGLTRGTRASGEVTVDSPQQVAFALDDPADLLLLDLQSTDGQTSLGLKLYGMNDTGGAWLIGATSEARAQHRATLPNPQPATYVVEVSVPAGGATEPVPFNLISYVLGGSVPEQPFTVTPRTLTGDTAEEVAVNASWDDLPGGAYLGSLVYGDTGVSTLITVDAGPTQPQPGENQSLSTTPSPETWLTPGGLLRIKAVGLTPGGTYSARINEGASVRQGTANEDGIADWAIFLPGDAPYGLNTIHLTGDDAELSAPFRVTPATISGGAASVAPTFDGRQLATYQVAIAGDADIRIRAVDSAGRVVYDGLATNVNGNRRTTDPFPVPAGTIDATATVVVPEGVESPTFTFEPLSVSAVETGSISITAVSDEGLATVGVSNPLEYRQDVSVEYRACDGSRRVAYDAFQPGESADTWALAGYVAVAVYDDFDRLLFEYANTGSSACAERTLEPTGQDAWLDLRDPSLPAPDGVPGSSVEVSADRPILGTLSYRYEPGIDTFSVIAGQGDRSDREVLVPAPGEDVNVTVEPVEQRGAVWSTDVALAEDEGTWAEIVVYEIEPEFFYLWQGINAAPVSLDDLQPVDPGELQPGVISISGEGRVGQTVTAEPGTWSKPDVTFGYQWSVNGTPVDGATQAQFTIPSGASGGQVVVTVTGTAPDGTTATGSSRPLEIASTVPHEEEPEPATPEAPTEPKPPWLAATGATFAGGLALLAAIALLAGTALVARRRRGSSHLAG